MKRLLPLPEVQGCLSPILQPAREEAKTCRMPPAESLRVCLNSPFSHPPILGDRELRARSCDNLRLLTEGQEGLTCFVQIDTHQPRQYTISVDSTSAFERSFVVLWLPR